MVYMYKAAANLSIERFKVKIANNTYCTMVPNTSFPCFGVALVSINNNLFHAPFLIVSVGSYFLSGNFGIARFWKSLWWKLSQPPLGNC